MKNKRLKIILTVVAVLLLIPIIAMQLTDEVNWTFFDFIVAGILLISAGLTLAYILQKVKSPIYRFSLSVIVLAILVLIWAELAVGIFGTSLAGH